MPLARIAWAVLSRGGNFTLNAKGLYVGANVCDHCRMTSEGLYEVATPGTPTYWLCCGCKEAVTMKREQSAKLQRMPSAPAASA